MYARFLQFPLGPGKRAEAEQIADRFAPMLAAQNGFISVTFVSDEEAGDFGAFLLWESQQDAEAAYETLTDAREQAIGPLLQGTPTNRLFEVYKPNS